MWLSNMFSRVCVMNGYICVSSNYKSNQMIYMLTCKHMHYITTTGVPQTCQHQCFTLYTPGCADESLVSSATYGIMHAVKFDSTNRHVCTCSCG